MFVTIEKIMYRIYNAFQKLPASRSSYAIREDSSSMFFFRKLPRSF